jgi:molecular chaperone HscC
MTDVAPFTLGVEVADRRGENVFMEGLYLPIIERNSIIPTSRSHVLATLQSNQAALDLKIYQGESRFVRDNIFLGSLKLSVPRAPAGQEKVDVRFTYDTSGLLEVDATVLSTKVRESLVIEGNPGVLSSEQIKTRLASLASLKTHPRDNVQNIAAVERGKRLYEENLGAARTAIGVALDAFSAVLERQNPQEIAEAQKKFDEFLRQFEGNILS